ncbi:MAG: sigma-54 dependent transcriptional regulator [Planctomycetota bacterium]|jgi:transcriptional regulator with GAF, ATPase, and Fis domain|nr:sigma-54 dependent transcriptional regulator [Planctomycetota bacterium]
MPDTADACSILDLLDAITEVRVKNPELRTAVLAALRLASANGHARSGRLYSLRFDGEISAIIAHGDSSLTEEQDRDLVIKAFESRETISFQDVTAHPLGKDRRIYGVLLLEASPEESGTFIADLFLQWHAVAEFINTQKAELIDENFALREEIKMQFSDRNIIGQSGVFRHVIESARRVASSSATVLVQGETGTGKELIARLIHEHSPRANEAFITVNCGALTETLLETELFGHVKGAFTGAVSDHKGRFEAATGGTIFLDEIGEISPAMQVRLLRVLQEMEIVRVGDTKTRKLDVRVVAATNRNLEEEVREGRFRADLFYRLNVVHLNVPPLRQRPEDIPPLVEHFLSVYCQRNCKYIESVTKDVLDIMKRYAWPGNVRELENCIEKMVVMAPGKEVTPDLLPLAVVAYGAASSPIADSADEASANETFEVMLKRQMQAETAGAVDRGAGDLYDVVRSKWERYLFEAVLDTTSNNKSKAARLLGITRNTLNARLGDLCTIKREWTVE